MRIGVMTFWWSEDNYGQLLQCYALQKYLRDLGHDAFLIRYRMKESAPLGLKKKLIKYGLHPWRIFDGFRRIASRWRGREDLAAHDRKFGEFRDTYLKMSERVYHSIEELRAAPPMADMYIVGSDQVWRFGETFTEGDVHAMMLDFGPENVRRISYAASFGRTDFTEKEIRRISPLLARFDRISIREQSGKVVCERAGIENVDVVCDPTLLLSAEIYLQIANPVRCAREYVFCYMLANECDFNYPALKVWANRKNMDVVYVTGNSTGISNYDDHDVAKAYLPISEWLGCLSNATYVVTNSFHCCVFATHFNRRLGVIMLSGEAKGMNSRMETLSEIRENRMTVIEGNRFDDLLNVFVGGGFKPNGGHSGRAFLACL